MSGWELGLVLLGCWLAGVVSGLLVLAWYSRRRFRQAFGRDAALLLQQPVTTPGARRVAPPPPR